MPLYCLIQKLEMRIICGFNELSFMGGSMGRAVGGAIVKGC